MPLVAKMVKVVTIAMIVPTTTKYYHWLTLSYKWSKSIAVNMLIWVIMLETSIDPWTSLNWSMAFAIHPPQYT
jgi:hypothetical protein